MVSSQRSNRGRGAGARLPGHQQLLLLAAVAVFVAVAGWLAIFAGGSKGGAGSTPAAEGPVSLGVLEPHRPEVGRPAPDFALLDARDGKTIRRLSDYRGKTVVLNWYASWCGPCRAEMPYFQEAAAVLDGEIVVLGVNLQESQSTAAAMLRDTGAQYPAVLDTDGEVARHYRLTGMPTTYFIDGEGIVRIFGSGLVTRETLRAELAKLGHHY
jgi:cytochrome c biogenesis protein CcmG/thiol:disulfide interchange protein DsbE